MLSDRLASVGTLAAGIAHEINNPLACVVANLELMAEELRALAIGHPASRWQDLEQMTREARDGAERVKHIVLGLRAFSRVDTDNRVVLDVRKVLDLAIELTGSELRHRARLVKDYQELPPIEADEGRLGQVFVNLLVNATQALPEGQADRHEIRVATTTAPDGRALIEIQDSGPGIPGELLSRIFDPFFTTKPIGVGTGLGLSICHSLVTALAGEITVASTPGAGATFRVYLPAARPPQTVTRNPSPHHRRTRARGARAGRRRRRHRREHAPPPAQHPRREIALDGREALGSWGGDAEFASSCRPDDAGDDGPSSTAPLAAELPALIGRS